MGNTRFLVNIVARSLCLWTQVLETKMVDMMC